MVEKSVPGFCMEVKDALKKTMDIQAEDELLLKSGKEIRKELKKRIIKIQKERLVEMLNETKADRVLLNNFQFN